MCKFSDKKSWAFFCCNKPEEKIIPASCHIYLITSLKSILHTHKKINDKIDNKTVPYDKTFFVRQNRNLPTNSIDKIEITNVELLFVVCRSEPKLRADTN